MVGSDASADMCCGAGLVLPGARNEQFGRIGRHVVGEGES
jgi:hypothetical protein